MACVSPESLDSCWLKSEHFPAWYDLLELFGLSSLVILCSPSVSPYTYSFIWKLKRQHFPPCTVLELCLRSFLSSDTVSHHFQLLPFPQTLITVDSVHLTTWYSTWVPSLWAFSGPTEHLQAESWVSHKAHLIWFSSLMGHNPVCLLSDIWNQLLCIFFQVPTCVEKKGSPLLVTLPRP